MSVLRTDTDSCEGDEQASTARSSASIDKFEKDNDSLDEKRTRAKADVLPVNVQLDSGELQVRVRTKWWQLWYVFEIWIVGDCQKRIVLLNAVIYRIPSGIPASPPASLDDAKVCSMS